jgi:hypothetical protein
MDNKWEAHIVAYGLTDLEARPRPFFLNQVNKSTQGLSGIATVESGSLASAYQAFEAGCKWAEQQCSIQEGFGCHIKLEQTRESIAMDELRLYRLPNVQKARRVILSPLVAAWDIHLDGQFNEGLLGYLVQQGYVLLDYKDSADHYVVTLTLHFLGPQACEEEFQLLTHELKSLGGFSGVAYWEDPLAFVVYGATLPRPILM